MARSLPNPEVKKTDVVRSHVAAGQWVDALRIAHTFRMLKADDKRDLKRAHEALHNPAFYAQLGKSPSDLVMTGVGVLRRLYA